MSTLPKFAKIERFSELFGISRRVVYRNLAEGNLKAIKVGTSTLVDVDHALNWLHSLPPAKIRSERPRSRSQRPEITQSAA